MMTPLEDERTAAWVLQTAVHAVLAAVFNDEPCELHTECGCVAQAELASWDRAAILTTAVEPWLRGLHPELLAELRDGVVCARIGAADEAVDHLFRVWEPLVVMAEAELDLPTRRSR
ncbi:hypothetical protein BBK82_08235 [Lentzea guizhouensis]|uniref:Uncharacterized protein n=1 Tax=Lentzea guizhouensis TaxID=1586287 RepID=A0A1B2HEC1_9PSEU|nr:hypothetical protein [Lentzea guizhouensis]ANZ36059.1 hypothetical protein BBK82_08235 [Lentzea guizhouensis]